MVWQPQAFGRDSESGRWPKHHTATIPHTLLTTNLCERRMHHPTRACCRLAAAGRAWTANCHQEYVGRVPQRQFSKEQRVAKTPNPQHNSFTAPPPQHVVRPLLPHGAPGRCWRPAPHQPHGACTPDPWPCGSLPCGHTIAEYYRQRAGFGLIVTEVRFPRLPQPPCAGLSLITHRVPVTSPLPRPNSSSLHT